MVEYYYFSSVWRNKVDVKGMAQNASRWVPQTLALSSSGQSPQLISQINQCGPRLLLLALTHTKGGRLVVHRLQECRWSTKTHIHMRTAPICRPCSLRPGISDSKMQWHCESEAEAQEESGTDGFKDWARYSHPDQVETQGTVTPLVSLLHDLISQDYRCCSSLGIISFQLSDTWHASTGWLCGYKDSKGRRYFK